MKAGKVHARMVQVAEKVSFNFRLEVTDPGGIGRGQVVISALQSAKGRLPRTS